MRLSVRAFQKSASDAREGLHGPVVQIGDGRGG